MELQKYIYILLGIYFGLEFIGHMVIMLNSEGLPSYFHDPDSLGGGGQAWFVAFLMIRLGLRVF